MKETNPKKLNLAALLKEEDVPTNPRICLELGCGNFAQPDDEFCAEHTCKQAVKQARFPSRKNGRIAGVSPWKQVGQ